MPLFEIELDDGRKFEVEAETPELAQKQAVETAKLSYDEATKGDVAAEVGRSVGRGGQYAAEFFGDIGDIGRAAVDQWIPGADDHQIIDQLNPLAPDSSGDIARQKLYDTDTAKYFTEEKIQRGGSAGLDAAKTFSEYILPTLTSGVSGLGRKALTEVATTGGGAALGEYLGNKWSGDTGEISEVVGAIFGGLMSGKVDRKLGEVIESFRNKINPKTGNALTDKEAEEVIKILMDQADDKELAIENALKALDDGDAGTFADLTQDAALYNVEELGKKGSKEKRAITRVGEEIDAQIVERIKDVTGTDTANTTGLAKSRLQSIKTRINEGFKGDKIEVATNAADEVSDAQKIATQAEDAATTAADVAETALSSSVLAVPMSKQSEKLADTYDRASKSVRSKQVQPLWDRFDNHPPIDTTGLPKIIEDSLAELTAIDLRKAQAAFKDELATIANLEEGVGTPPKEIHSVISSIKNTLRDLESPQAYQKFVGKMNRTLEEFLEKSKAGPLYVNARNAELDFQQRFNPGGLGKSRRQAESGKLLASKLAKDFEAGAVTADYLKQARSPAIMRQAAQTLRALAHRDAQTPTDLSAFLHKYDEILTEFPDVKADLMNARELMAVADVAEQTGKGVTKQQGAVVQGVEQRLSKSLTEIESKRIASGKGLDKSVLGQYADNPAALVDKILSDPAPLKEMERLIKTASRLPDGLNSLKAIVGDRFLKGIKKVGGRVDPKVVEDFEKIKPLLEKGLMNSDEIAVIEAALGRTKTSVLRKAAGVQRPKTSMQEMGNLASSGIAAIAMNIIPGSSLILAGAVRRVVKEQLARNPDPVIVKGLQELIDNPARFRKALEGFNPTTPEASAQKVWEIINQIVVKPLNFARKTTTSKLTPPAMVTLGDEETIN